MEVMVNEHTDTDDCTCPACELYRRYQTQYAEYENKKRFRVVDTDGKDAESIEAALNEYYREGYDLTAVVKPYFVMRAVPPNPPSTADVIQELQRRQQIKPVKVPEDGTPPNPDDWGPMMGGIQ
jgi:hypothetical protein